MTTELARSDETRIAIAETDTEDLAELIAANLGDTGFGAQDLDRVKVPSAGATIWTVPTIEGETHAEELVGVVAHWHARKAYWAKSLEDGGGGQAPDCQSEDMKTGIGNPGGPCAACPYNAFGSAKKGEGKACKDVIELFMVQGDDILPTVVSVPASSIKNIRQYFLRLIGRKVPFYGALTRLRLSKATSKGGVVYSQIEPSLVRALEGDERARVKRYSDAIRAVAATVPIDAGEAEPAGPEGDIAYWRSRAFAVYQEAGGDPSDQERSRAAFGAILGKDPARSRSEYTADEWAEIALHYAGEPAVVPNEAPPEPEQAETLPDLGDFDMSGEPEPDAKKRVKETLKAGEKGTFAEASAQQRGF